MPETSESILLSVKDAIGPAEDYEAFDKELIIFINSAFAELNSIGVGPSEEFTIEDNTATWDDFDPNLSSMVKDYVTKKVHLAFDPPSSSFVLSAMERDIERLEWRLFAKAELEA